MSSITMFARGDRAVLLTDTAGTDSDFVVRAWVSKVTVIPHMKIALTVQGSAEAAATFANVLAYEFGSFDGIIAGGAAHLEQAHDQHMMRWSDEASAPEFAMGIVGWSEERKRFEAYFIQSRDIEGVPAFRFVRRDLVMAPTLHETDLDALRIPKDGAAFASDAEAYLLRIIGVQRHATTPRPGTDGGEHGHVIGGQVVATELTRDGISQRVIHRWADDLNEPIRPGSIQVEMAAIAAKHAGSTAAAPIAGTSRAERRAAKAQARKGRVHA